MIRLSQRSDLPELIELWQEAFGDDKEWIESFIDAFYIPNNTLLDVQNNEISAALYLIDGDMLIGGKRHAAYYLYAACTKIKFRGKGIMTRLLEFAANEARQRGRNFICLKPGEKSLFDFYESRGYLKAFGKRRLTVVRKNAPSRKTEITCEEVQSLAALRNKAFGDCNYFAFGDDAVRNAISLSIKGGARLFTCRKGYALYTVNSTKCTVNEFTFTDDYIDEFAKYIFANHHCDFVSFMLASRKVPEEKGTFESDAMILPLNREAAEAIGEINDAYLGLTLE